MINIRLYLGMNVEEETINNRIYKKEDFQTAIAKFMEKDFRYVISNNRFSYNLCDIIASVEEIKIHDDNKISSVIKFLETPKGISFYNRFKDDSKFYSKVVLNPHIYAHEVNGSRVSIDRISHFSVLVK